MKTEVRITEKDLGGNGCREVGVEEVAEKQGKKCHSFQRDNFRPATNHGDVSSE